MLNLFCAGSSRKELGERRGFIGIVGYLDGKIVLKHAACVGLASIHEASYHALITALVLSKRVGERKLDIKSDSNLVVMQLKGDCAIDVKRLASLASTFHQLEDSFDLVTVEQGTDDDAKSLAQLSDPLDYIDPSLRKAA